MIQATKTRQKCPYPDECPMGPKRTGYTCGMAFELCHGDPADENAPRELICTFCWGAMMGFKAFLAERKRQQAASGIVIAQQGPPAPLAGPGSELRGS